MIKKFIGKSVFMMLLGLAMGILSKYGDIAYANSVFSLFGLLSSGLLLWLVIGTAFICLSASRRNFTILFSVFMASMLISYYLFSLIVVKYIYIKIIIFWIVIFVLALAFGNLIFSKRDTKLFKILFAISSLLAIIYDAIIINGVQLEIVIAEVLLFIIMLLYINTVGKSKKT